MYFYTEINILSSVFPHEVMLEESSKNDSLSITLIQEIHIAICNYIIIHSIKLRNPVEETLLINSLGSGFCDNFSTVKRHFFSDK